MSHPGVAAAPTRTTARESAVFSKVNRRLLPLLIVCYAFAYLDRVNIGYAKLHMQVDYPGLTEAVFGLGAGLFFLAYACLEIPSNLLMNRIGARKTVTRIMILWGITSASMLFVRDPTLFYVLRILLGVFEAGFAPAIILYLTFWYPAKRMASVMGIYTLAGPVGAIVGSAGSAMIIAATDGLGGLSGWQWMFLIQGLPCVLLGLVFWFFMVDKPEQASWLTSDERQIITNQLDATRANQHTSSFLVVLRNPTVYVISLAYFGIMCGIYATSFWLPTILLENGIKDKFEIGVLSAIPPLIAMPTMYFLARSSDRFQDRTWHAIIPAAAAGCGLVIAVYTSSNFLVSFIALIVAVAAVNGAYTVLWAVPSQHFGGTAAAGGIAFINTIGILGGFVAPTMIGYVKEATGSTQSGLLVMAALLVVSIAALAVLPKVMHREIAARSNL